MTYFTNAYTVGQAKSMYRMLAKENHPDLYGHEATATMQAINDEYHDLLESLNGSTSVGSDGKQHTYHYSYDVEQAVMDKIAELLALNLVGCEIELIGTWVWVSGDTKPVKDKLGKDGAGLRWHSKRERWYWHGKTYRRRYNKNASFSDIRQMYGSRSFEAETEGAVVLA